MMALAVASLRRSPPSRREMPPLSVESSEPIRRARAARSIVVVKGPFWLPTVNGTGSADPERLQTFNEGDARYFQSQG